MLSVRLCSRNGAVKISNPRRVATPFFKNFERRKMDLENMDYPSLFKGQYCSADDNERHDTPAGRSN
jgi:hypothetical protein